MAFALTVESKTTVPISERTSLLGNDPNISASPSSNGIHTEGGGSLIRPSASYSIQGGGDGGYGSAESTQRRFIEPQHSGSVRTESRSSWRMWLAVLFLYEEILFLLNIVILSSLLFVFLSSGITSFPLYSLVVSLL